MNDLLGPGHEKMASPFLAVGRQEHPRLTLGFQDQYREIIPWSRIGDVSRTKTPPIAVRWLRRAAVVATAPLVNFDLAIDALPR